MKENLTRRTFLNAAGTTALAGSLAASFTHGADQPLPGKTLKILGVACGPRKGMTTARAVETALGAAKKVHDRIETELIDLGGLNIAGWSPNPPNDDFSSILPKLKDPAVAGLVMGSPAYFRGLSSLCKAFIERCSPLREPVMLLANKPVGVVAVGGFRNGGQELVIEQIQTAMLCFGMIPVGGKAPAFQGATLVASQNEISADELGLHTAKQLGIGVAEAVLRLTAG